MDSMFDNLFDWDETSPLKLQTQVAHYIEKSVNSVIFFRYFIALVQGSVFNFVARL